MPRRASTLVTLLGSCMLAQAALGESAPRPDGGDEGADRTLPDQGFEDVGPVEDARVLIDTGASADAEVRTDAVVPLDDAAAQDAGVAPSPDTGIAPLETAPAGRRLRGRRARRWGMGMGRDRCADAARATTGSVSSGAAE